MTKNCCWKFFCNYCILSKWFEPSGISSLFSVIVGVRVVVKRTVMLFVTDILTP